MQAIASKLLAAAGWIGVAMIEFRVADDGTPYLMEVNGRFWGSLQLAIDCGIDFPWLLYQITQGLSVAEPQAYAVGRRLRWLMGDLDSLFVRLRQTLLSRPVKARALGAFMRSFLDPACRQEVLRISDPLPGVVEVVEWFKALRSG
jgi:predicted ATP-grasp superfamily ATP-dependent carboligase